jgi:hypothetical protein
MQGSFLNPGDKPYGLVRLGHVDVALLNGLLPEEWVNTTLSLYRTPQSLSLTVLHVLRFALVIIVVVPSSLWLINGPRRTWLLMVPLVLGLALTQIETIVIRLPLANPRYLYPLLPTFGVGAGLAFIRSAGLRGTIVAACALTLGLAGLWAYLSTVPTLTG